MEQFYYNHMTKQQQAAYHNILTGVKNLSDEFQIPVLPAEELANVFFQMLPEEDPFPYDKVKR